MTPDLLLAYDPNRIRPGWVALVIVLALGVATYLLWRSMNSQLRRIDVPEHEQDDADGMPDSGGGDGHHAEGDERPQDETPSSKDADRNHPV